MERAKVQITKGIDRDKEVKGVEVHVCEDFYITVARAGNPNAKRVIEELSSAPEVDQARRAGMLTPQIRESIFKKSLARAVLIGWRGLTENGKDLPYSVETAEWLLEQEDIYDLVCSVSAKNDNFRADAVAKAAETLGNA